MFLFLTKINLVDQSEFLRYIFEDMDMENNTVILSSTQTSNISTCH